MSKQLPPRYGNCQCICHIQHDISHVTPCCKRSDAPEYQQRTVSEWWQIQKELTKRVEQLETEIERMKKYWV